MKKTLFVLGDSISIDYTPYLKAYLGGDWQVSRKGDLPATAIPGEPEPDNGGDSRVIGIYLKEMLPRLSAKTILLNCGLHDIKRHPLPSSAAQVALQDYQNNLRNTLSLIRSYQKQVLWVTITPVSDQQHAACEKTFFRFDTDVREYNQAAETIMRAAGVPVLDLGSFTRNLPGPIYRDHVHYTETISQLQAAFICGGVMNY